MQAREAAEAAAAVAIAHEAAALARQKRDLLGLLKEAQTDIARSGAALATAEAEAVEAAEEASVEGVAVERALALRLFWYSRP